MPTMTETPLISLRNVACRYGIRQGRLGFKYYDALTDLTMNIYHGETLGVVGRNGAGKSTLLKLISRIILPDMGEIIYHKSVSVSLLTLELGFSPELSGRYNAIMGAMFLGHTKKEAIARLHRIVEFAELEEWIEDPLKTYSSGMRARLGFAVAMEMNPDILLIDEVLGVGDEAFMEKSVNAMKEKMRNGQTVVFVSHSAPLVQSLCSRTVWIENGATRMIGDTGEVLQAYHESHKSQPILSGQHRR
jgi:lipopolysaccharide transport system ATP-binding protein